MGDSLIDLLDAIADITAICEKIIRHENELYREEHRKLREEIERLKMEKSNLTNEALEDLLKNER